jgi:hypothetical protein
MMRCLHMRIEPRHSSDSHPSRTSLAPHAFGICSFGAAGLAKWRMRLQGGLEGHEVCHRGAPRPASDHPRWSRHVGALDRP